MKTDCLTISLVILFLLFATLSFISITLTPIVNDAIEYAVKMAVVPGGEG